MSARFPQENSKERKLVFSRKKIVYFVCRKRVTHFRFVYYVVGHCKMILLQILGPFLPFVEFLEIFCPSSKFRKSVAFRSGSESFRLSSTNKVLEFFCNYGLKSTSIVHVLSGRNDQWSAGWQSVSSLFCFSPHSHSSYHPSFSIFVFVFIFSFVFAFMFLFVFDFVFFFVFVFVLSLAHLLCVSLLILIPTLTRPCLSLLRQRLLYFGEVSKNL